ncbi:hypothetical protein HF563_18705 [Acidithiobacillus ferridurans]|nr:hypothetical protein [Acidithiobacillus ferridurans]
MTAAGGWPVRAAEKALGMHPMQDGDGIDFMMVGDCGYLSVPTLQKELMKVY